MNRRSVNSSNVASVGWEPSEADPSVGTLEVEFHRGGVYQYEDVPETEYQALLGANSVGKYLNANIVGQYSEARV